MKSSAQNELQKKKRKEKKKGYTGIYHPHSRFERGNKASKRIALAKLTIIFVFKIQQGTASRFAAFI